MSGKSPTLRRHGNADLKGLDKTPYSNDIEDSNTKMQSKYFQEPKKQINLKRNTTKLTGFESNDSKKIGSGLSDVNSKFSAPRRAPVKRGFTNLKINTDFSSK